ncbi:reverse transcriptase domain-containing protein [Tanacetum coccineum]
MDVFAWEPVDMTGIPRRIIEHSLNVNPSIEPVAQKRRFLAFDRTQVVIKEVEEWVSARIVRLMKYPTWISNSVLVKKSDRNAYKGYHQVQMAQDNEEKMTFYTDQDTYFYTKMPFGLKNAGATYQRLVDAAFQSQIGRNLEAYVDDMVIKSNEEKVLIADIVETFDNLRRINMNLNPKNVRLEWKKENFWDMWSPLKGSGFLSWSAEKSLPFFKTSKDITKENKDEYRWTESAEKAFQEIKKVIVELPLLTTLVKEEMLYVYVAATAEAMSAVLLTKRKGKQCPIHYASLTLNEAERNYVPLEKLALSLLHMSRRLRRYFEAHLINIIMDQPLKQILNKAQASGKLAKYSVELGAYNITYELRNAIKGQDLADFLLEAPVGTPTEEFFLLPAKVQNKDGVEKWTLFMDGASNSKGSGDGLVLISPSGVEFMYALLLNFTSTNNEAEYGALLAGLRMARKMKEIGAIVEEEEDNWMTPIIRCLAEEVWPEDKDERRALRMKINQPTMSSGRYTWDPVECTSERGTCSGAEAPQNTNEFNHGSMAILPMGNGHPWTPTSSIQKIEVRHCSHRLLHKVDRGEAVGQDYREGCKEVSVGQHCVPVRAPLGKARKRDGGMSQRSTNVLWAHSTSLKQSNSETPFSLTYGNAAVIPTEIGMPTHRTIMIGEDGNEDELRLNMDLLQERREAATIRKAKYKTKNETKLKEYK